MSGKYGDILDDFQEEAIRIEKAAAENGWPLRIIGCLAFRIKCPDYVDLHKAMGREVTDIDYVTYYKHQRDIINLFRDDLGYKWIPPGFAHGFYVLSDWADVIYKVTDYYAPEWDRTLLWNDPEIGIEWPLINGGLLNISTKDAAGTRLRDADTFK